MFLADRAAEAQNWPFAHSIGDPTHKLASILRERQILPLVITGKGGDKGYNTYYYRTHKLMGRYKHGCVQPGLLIVRGGLDNIMLRWAINPKILNGFGKLITNQTSLCSFCHKNGNARCFRSPEDSSSMGSSGAEARFRREWGNRC